MTRTWRGAVQGLIAGLAAVAVLAGGCTDRQPEPQRPPPPSPSAVAAPDGRTTEPQDGGRLCVEHESIRGEIVAVAATSDGIAVVEREGPDGARLHLPGGTAVPTGLASTDLASSAGALWVTNSSGRGVEYPSDQEGPGVPEENTVKRFALDGTLLETYELANPVAISAGRTDGVWVVALGPEARVHHLPEDEAEATSSWPLPGQGPVDIVVGLDGVWVLTQTELGSSIVQIDPSQGIIVEQYEIARMSLFSLAAADDGVWGLAGGKDGGIIDLLDHDRSVVSVPFPHTLTVHGGQFWVGTDGPEVAVVDPGTGRPLETIPLPALPETSISTSSGVVVATPSQVLAVC